MKNPLHIGQIEIFRLNGGEIAMDGGAMFGAVPKILWSKRYPPDSDNYLLLKNAPLLIKTPAALILVETGIGNKFTEKQKQIFRVSDEWDLPSELAALGVGREDIDFVILTHCDFDHAGGIVMFSDNQTPELTFPNARHVIQKTEWEDATKPNVRSAHTYWPVNFTGLEESGNLLLVEGAQEISPGVRVEQTGGHTRGHQVVRIGSGPLEALHMGDLLPFHAHANPLWIMAFDNYPMDVIAQKQKLMGPAIAGGSWFTFYHDPQIAACRFDERGKVIEQWPGE